MELRRRTEARQQLEDKRASVGKPKVTPAYEYLYWTHTPGGVLIRIKCAKGGRGKGASWAIADRLLDKAHTQPSLILCTREVQNSIADSVHRLLVNRIRALGYGDFFHVTQNSIKNIITGSEFLFRGLNDLTVDNVKSMEGITDVWLAEAHTVGAKSWMVLEPTIRTEGSTIYVDYNPEEEDAPTNVKFTQHVPDNIVVRHLTFEDNPYFPEVLETLRQQALKRIADFSAAGNEEAAAQAQLDYNHVWLGHTKKISKSSILGAYYTIETFTPKIDEGDWEGPLDGADWGFGSDPTTRVRCWIWTRTNGKRYLCIEHEVYLQGTEGNALELRHLPKEFDTFPDSRETLIIADCAQPQNITYMQNQGYRIEPCDKWSGSVEDGIEHIRGTYDGMIIHPRCPKTAEECRLYSYKTDKLTGEVLNDIIDKWNHCIDAIRYALNKAIQYARGGHLFG